MAACGGEAEHEPAAEQSQHGAPILETGAGAGAPGPSALPTMPPVVWPRAAGGGAAGVAALSELVEERVVPPPVPDPGHRDAPRPSREPQTLAESSAATVDLAAFARAPADRPGALAFALPAEAEAAEEAAGLAWAEEAPVAEARGAATASAPDVLRPSEPSLPAPAAPPAPLPLSPSVFSRPALPAPSPIPRPAPWPTTWPTTLPPPPDQVRWYIGLALRLAGGLALAVAVGVLLLIALYRVLDPPTSMLMLGRRISGTPVHQRWVPLEHISAYLSQAVILSEDARFCRHSGVDWGELAEAFENSRDGVARGGSTITMQVVKNLFLWPSRSYLRKALEFPLAYGVELAWSKRRILEIYLNIAEWGPGIFGAEAAALYHFRKPAAFLTPREAALLAVALPNPLQRRPGRPGPGLLRLASHLAMRMHPGVAIGCLRAPP
jgi:monofunctional biosynthetic peptidoglycan transglycosylase